MRTHAKKKGNFLETLLDKNDLKTQLRYNNHAVFKTEGFFMRKPTQNPGIDAIFAIVLPHNKREIMYLT